VTSGEGAEITQAKLLLNGLKADPVSADKGQDGDALIDRRRKGRHSVQAPSRHAAYL
jgi:hypothetical protein